MTIETPSAGILKIEHVEGTSPIVQLLDNPEARSWVDKSLNKAAHQLETPSVRCVAPETYRWAFCYSLHRLLELLKTGEPVRLWDVNREFAAKNEYFDDEGFGNACHLLFSL